MDERERRIGLNETVFRGANEALRGLNETFAAYTEKMELVIRVHQTTTLPGQEQLHSNHPVLVSHLPALQKVEASLKWKSNRGISRAIAATSASGRALVA
jgi:hypothetical protein